MIFIATTIHLETFYVGVMQSFVTGLSVKVSFRYLNGFFSFGGKRNPMVVCKIINIKT